MSRSYRKSCKGIGGFYTPICYFSNKKSRTHANRQFREKSRMLLIKDIKYDNLENHINVNNIREVSDVWDFDSDGLKFYHNYNDFDWNYYDKKIIRKIKIK